MKLSRDEKRLTLLASLHGGTTYNGSIVWCWKPECMGLQPHAYPDDDLVAINEQYSQGKGTSDLHCQVQ
jgi:hypothetical protein